MSNQDYNIKKVLGKFVNKQSFNTTSFVRVELSNKTNLVKPDKNIFILNNVDQFKLEQNSSNCYRIGGKLEILTSNALFGSWNDAPSSDDWSPEILDEDYISKNWVLQITYPSDNDITTDIVSHSLTGDKTSKPDKGIQIDTITSINITGRREQVLLRTVQKHGIPTIGEYIYIEPLNTTNPAELGYLGFHRIIDFEADNNEYGLILETPYISDALYGNIKRVYEPSFEDINFSDSFDIPQLESVDSNGQNIGTLDHLMLSHENHDLRLGDFVDIRVNDYSVVNGIHEVVGLPNNNEFIIRQAVAPPTGGPLLVSTMPTVEIKYRVINGTPSEYYLRKFKVITNLNDYEVYNAAFSQNLFSDDISNGVSLFHFDKDINVTDLTDNLGRPLTDLFLTITKRASNGNAAYNGYRLWGNTTTLMEDNSGVVPYSDSSLYNMETVSWWVNTPSDISGTISNPSSGYTYFGDFVEYNRSFLNETVLSKTVHRMGISRVEVGSTVPATPNGVFSSDGEGYYYYPHNKIQIRKFSDIIETAPNRDDEIIPDYVQFNNDGTISWRELLDIGFFEVGVNGIDHPFVNGCNYLYDNYAIYIRRQRPADSTDFAVSDSDYIKIDPNSLGKKC